MNTDAQVMAWIYDTYQMMHRHTINLAVVTGKPLDLGGIPGRTRATAQGLAYVLERALERGEVPGVTRIEGSRVAVQGYGNVGRYSVLILKELGPTSSRSATSAAAPPTRTAWTSRRWRSSSARRAPPGAPRARGSWT